MHIMKTICAKIHDDFTLLLTNISRIIQILFDYEIYLQIRIEFASKSLVPNYLNDASKCMAIRNAL